VHELLDLRRRFLAEPVEVRRDLPQVRLRRRAALVELRRLGRGDVRDDLAEAAEVSTEVPG
jgi:hypothetical protein